MKKIFALIAMVLPMVVMAQEKKDASLPVPQSEQTLLVAAELSKYGYANKDALSLIQAARLSKQAGFAEESREKAEGGAAESGKQGGQAFDIHGRVVVG